MIQGHYWREGTRADLIRPLSTLPRVNDLVICVINTKGKKFNAYLEVADTLIIRSDKYREIGDIIGWFPHS